MQQVQIPRRSARIAAKMAAAAPAAAAAAGAQPKSDAPPTEVVITIQIPVRRFPAANQAEKQESITICGQLLCYIENAYGMSDKAGYAAQLFNEIVRQPIILALSPRFRAVAINKAAELRAQLNAIPCYYAAQDLENALNSFDDLLYDIHLHPWYTE